MAFLVWIYGLLQEGGRLGPARAVAVATAAVVGLALFALPLSPAPRAEAAVGASAASGGIAWQRFDPDAIARERAAGRPVFVDFTADWCITCQVNESVVLSNDAVRGELERWNYATFKADWTLHDASIGRELAAWGRAGVPMYLVYPADEGRTAELLPELLTLDDTVRALREAGEGA